MEENILYNLKKYFGYDSFRQGQEELISNILKGKDVLGILPTGGGKSICYQLPAIIKDGLCLVISPLISLMKDQVDALEEDGIKSAFINSSQSYDDYVKSLEMARTGQIKLLYLAPERHENLTYCLVLNPKPLCHRLL